MERNSLRDGRERRIEEKGGVRREEEKLDDCGEIWLSTVCLQLVFRKSRLFFRAAVCTFCIYLAVCLNRLSRNSEDRFLATMNHRFCQLWRVILL